MKLLCFLGALSVTVPVWSGAAEGCACREGLGVTSLMGDASQEHLAASEQQQNLPEPFLCKCSLQ